MKGLSLFKKLKLARQKIEGKEIAHQGVEEFGFYIPQRDTMQTIKNKQPLTSEQIEDYLKYVTSNYMLSESDIEILGDFLSEWTIMTTDMERVTNRYQMARRNIVECLKNGCYPSALDELWISNKTFIDHNRNGDARVIYKVINDGKVDIQVKLGREDLQLGCEIRYLKNKLRETVFNQSLEKTL